MRLLIVWARANQPNLGVRALGSGAAIIARRAFPDSEVRLHGTGGGSALEPANDGPMNIGHVPPLAREYVQPRHGLREWLRSFDLVLDTRAGDSFTDVYGLRRLAKMSALPELAHRWGVPVVLLPQTLGPFESRAGRLLARRSLATAAGVLARDPESAEAAARLGRPVDAVSTDLVFALPREPVDRDRDVVLNPSGLLWRGNPHVDADRYRRACVEIVDGLLDRGRRVTLLPHVAGSDVESGDDDRVAVDSLRRLVSGPVDVAVPESLEDARRLLGSARLVIGARMHACLNALSMGTPVVPMAYTRKFAALLSPLGVTTTVDLRTERAPGARVLEHVARDDLAEQAATAAVRAPLLLDEAVRVLREVAASAARRN